MGNDQDASDFSQTYVDHCDQKAKEIVIELNKMLGSYEGDFSLTDAQISLLQFHLVDQLMFFFGDTIRLHRSDPAGTKNLVSIGAQIAGKKSAKKRSETSLKNRFLDFAVEQNKRNVKLKKNQIVKIFMRENPNASEATLRRYLTEVPIRWINEDGSPAD